MNWVRRFGGGEDGGVCLCRGREWKDTRMVINSGTWFYWAVESNNGFWCSICGGVMKLGNNKGNKRVKLLEK